MSDSNEDEKKDYQTRVLEDNNKRLIDIQTDIGIMKGHIRILNSEEGRLDVRVAQLENIILPFITNLKRLGKYVVGIGAIIGGIYSLLQILMWFHYL